MKRPNNYDIFIIFLMAGAIFSGIMFALTVLRGGRE